MLRNTVVDQYNIILIDYNAIFEERSIDIINELYDLGLVIEDNCNVDKTVRSAITHHFIDSVCKTNLKLLKSIERPVYVTCSSCYDKLELGTYLDGRLGELINTLFKSINSMVGIDYIDSTREWNEFVDDVKSREGEMIEMLSTINRNKPRDLNRLYKFVKTHGLKGLEDQFFNQQQYKQVFI